MPESVEHSFLKQRIGDSLHAFSKTGLLGVSEADRGKYDYACRLERDFTRALDAQVCWGNKAALQGDLQRLLIGSEAPIRLLVLKGSVETHRQLDEVLGDYRRADPARLAGFRYLSLPDGFDADDEAQREWMSSTLNRRICTDLLFGVVFGHLRRRELMSYINHGGTFGLKCAILAICSRRPIESVSELLAALGKISKGPVREALVMLTASGLLHQQPLSQPCYPTLKGRFLLDLMSRLLFSARTGTRWSAELTLILDYLGLPTDRFWSEAELVDSVGRKDLGYSFTWGPLAQLLISAIWAAGYFGVDLLENIDPRHPVFRSQLDWGQFANLIPDEPVSFDTIVGLD